MKNTKKKQTPLPDLGTFLQQARIAKGFSQKEVSIKLGYESAQFISDWERGIRSPPGNKLKKLAQLYEVCAERLIDIILNERALILEKELRKDFFGT